VPAEGGPVALLANKAGWEPIESPDGKFIYFAVNTAEGSSLLRVPTEGGEVQQVIGSLSVGYNYAVIGDGIYFIPRRDPKSAHSLQLLNTATGKIQRIASLQDPVPLGLSVSPDRRWIQYSQADQAGSGLMLVESFR
jgi:hypothetical protein